MNLNQLKIFYCTARYGNLSAAADILFITQPAVTKGIQRLQAHYDIRLFNRFGKKLVLTDAGEALYSIAEKIFQLETQAEESIRDYQEKRAGHIRILSSESFGAYYLPSILATFGKKNPHIRISGANLPTEQVVEKTAALQNDVGFISYHVDHPKLKIREIMEDRLVIIAATEHPLSQKRCIKARDLEGQTFVMHETGSAPRKAFEALIRKNHLSVEVPIEITSIRAIKKLVESGIGLGVVSEYVARDEIEIGRLRAIPVADDCMKRKYYMVYHREKYISESLQSFMREVCHWGDAECSDVGALNTQAREMTAAGL